MQAKKPRQEGEGATERNSLWVLSRARWPGRAQRPLVAGALLVQFWGPRQKGPLCRPAGTPAREPPPAHRAVSAAPGAGVGSRDAGAELYWAGDDGGLSTLAETCYF